MDCWVLRHCEAQDAEEYRRALLRTYLSEQFGGVILGPVVVYTEIFGLSRDGVLRIYEAWLKTSMVLLALYTTRNATMLSAIGINLWACLKTAL